MSESIFESMSEEEIMVDSTDFTDYVEKEKRQKSIIKIIIVILVITTIIIAGVFFFKLIANKTETPVEVLEVAQSGEVENIEVEVIEESTEPLLELYENAPVVTARQVVTETTKNSIIAGENELVLDEIKISETINKCEVVNPTDFCLAAISEFEGNTLNIYFMNDAVHSRLFENPSSFMEFEVPGSPATALIEISISGEEGQVLTVVNKDSSGFMLALPHDMTSEEIQELVTHLSVN